MLRRITLMVAALLVMFSLGCGNKNEPKKRPEAVEPGPTAQELFLAGNAELDKANYRGAISAYSKAVYRDPSRWDIYMNKAIAHSKAAEFEDALGAVETAFQNGGSEQPDLYYNLGNIYQERGMYKEAIESYRAGLVYRAGPHIDSLVNIGAAYVFLRQFDEAGATYDHLRQIAPDEPAALHGLALIQHLQDNYQQAADMYGEVHIMAPDFANSYFNRGSVLAKMEKWDEAIDAMNSYLRYAPQGPYAKSAQSRIEFYRTKVNR